MMLPLLDQAEVTASEFITRFSSCMFNLVRSSVMTSPEPFSCRRADMIVCLMLRRAKRTIILAGFPSFLGANLCAASIVSGASSIPSFALNRSIHAATQSSRGGAGRRLVLVVELAGVHLVLGLIAAASAGVGSFEEGVT